MSDEDDVFLLPFPRRVHQPGQDAPPDDLLRPGLDILERLALLELVGPVVVGGGRDGVACVPGLSLGGTKELFPEERGRRHGVGVGC